MSNIIQQLGQQAALVEKVDSVKYADDDGFRWGRAALGGGAGGAGGLGLAVLADKPFQMAERTNEPLNLLSDGRTNLPRYSRHSRRSISRFLGDHISRMATPSAMSEAMRDRRLAYNLGHAETPRLQAVVDRVVKSRGRQKGLQWLGLGGHTSTPLAARHNPGSYADLAEFVDWGRGGRSWPIPEHLLRDAYTARTVPKVPSLSRALTSVTDTSRVPLDPHVLGMANVRAMIKRLRQGRAATALRNIRRIRTPLALGLIGGSSLLGALAAGNSGSGRQVGQ